MAGTWTPQTAVENDSVRDKDPEWIKVLCMVLGYSRQKS
jgi:hypothetical protein